VYIDIASSKTGSSRKEFTRLLKDCQSHDLEIIITKSISRFGRDTVEILDALNQLKLLGIRVIFEQEELDTANTDSDLMISIIESIAQAENESRSDNIKWGIKQHAANGTSKLYNRKCYGYVNASDGSLIIEDVEAEDLKLIFNMYIQGKSVIGIVSKLERLGIKSPTGKGKWCKRTIDVMLSNEKYIGNVRLLGVNPTYSTGQVILPVLFGFLLRIKSFNELNLIIQNHEFSKLFPRGTKLPSTDAIRDTQNSS